MWDSLAGNLTDLSISLILTEFHWDKISFPFHFPIDTFCRDPMESLPLQNKGLSVTKGFEALSKQIVLYTYHYYSPIKLCGSLMDKLFLFSAFKNRHYEGNE